MKKVLLFLSSIALAGCFFSIGGCAHVPASGPRIELNDGRKTLLYASPDLSAFEWKAPRNEVARVFIMALQSLSKKCEDSNKAAQKTIAELQSKSKSKKK